MSAVYKVKSVLTRAPAVLERSNPQFPASSPALRPATRAIAVTVAASTVRHAANVASVKYAAILKGSGSCVCIDGSECGSSLCKGCPPQSAGCDGCRCLPPKNAKQVDANPFFILETSQGWRDGCGGGVTQGLVVGSSRSTPRRLSRTPHGRLLGRTTMELRV